MGTYASSVGPADLFTLTFEAEDAVTVGALVVLGTAQTQVKNCATANSKAVIGVAVKQGMTSIADGNNVPVRILGAAEVIAADGNIAAGDYVRADNTTPTRVTTISSGGEQQNIVGRALTASNAAGDRIVILLQNQPGSTVS